MNNKIKQIFALLFVVATLLLMIGSVSAANAVELDENLEASIVVDDVDSIDDDGFIPNLDDKVSSQTNDDEAIDDNLNDINSKVVVSSEEQTTIGAKDSNEDVLTDDTPAFTIIKTPRTSTAMVGDIVTYDIFVQYKIYSLNLVKFFKSNMHPFGRDAPAFNAPSSRPAA